MIQVIPATMAHAARLDLRPGDRAEIAALGLTPDLALRRSLERALWSDAYVVHDGEGAGGEVAAIVGLGLPSMLARVATPWLLTGMPVDRHRKAFLRLTRERVERLRGEWAELVNYVHADYAQAVRWLAWLGFSLAPAAPFGPRGALFHRATLRGLR